MCCYDVCLNGVKQHHQTEALALVSSLVIKQGSLVPALLLSSVKVLSSRGR